MQLLQAHVASGAAAPAPSPSPMQGPTCDLDVDGVVVTNIPESHVSQVRAMVSYFEALAVGGSSSDQESAEDQEEREEEMKSEARDYESVGDADGHAAVLGEESSYEEADESELAEVEAEVMGAPYAAPSLGHGTWVPAPSPAISERMAAALPAGLPATPLMPLAHGAMAPAAHAPPSTPACTPADGFTPGDQRRHLETLDALAALRDAHAGYAANPSSPTSPTDAVTAVAAEVTTPLGESAAWYVEQGGGSAVSPPAPYSITPVDMDAVRRGTGSALRGEVRARLQRLKAELQAARTKLHQVDCGLAAIATPGSASVSRQSSLRAASPTADAGVQESSRAEPAAPVPQEHVTPAGIAAPTPKTRPSVRFADSVKSGSPEHRALRPGTPATVSTVEAEGELEPRPELGSAREVAQPVAAVPGPAMALFPESTWAEAAAAPNERAGAAPAPAATPLRRLTLDSDSDSDGEGVGTTGSSRVAVRLGTPLGAGIAPRGTPVTHAESRFAGALAGLGTPSMSRFSSASSSSMTPEPAALLAMRPVVGRVRRGPGAGGRRVSLSEEKEFRRRAAALKIHVSPYFKRNKGQRGDDPMTTAL